MHGYGGGRVITALFSFPCNFSVVEIINILPLLLDQKIKQEIYDIYTAECLRIITENTAKMGHGSYIKKSYKDIISPKATDNRTGEEIAADVIKKIGLQVIG